ncbi:MAG: tetratricopeptide repeat protein [Calditrichaeota bacterium]|nr:tetratricopeptide repeat protein [Calditrichota bacterium]
MTENEKQQPLVVTDENWEEVFWEMAAVSPYLETYLKSYLQMYTKHLGPDWVEKVSQFLRLIYGENPAEALEFYEQNLSHYPPNAWLIIFVADAECYQKAHYFDARHLYRQAEKELPDFPKIHLDLGLIFMLLGDWKQALTHYNQTFACAPNDPINTTDLQAKALFNQAIIYANYLHDVRKSAELLRSALEIRPDYEMAKRALKNMKQSII